MVNMQQAKTVGKSISFDITDDRPEMPVSSGSQDSKALEQVYGIK